MHAIDEMSAVLARVGIQANDTAMQFYGTAAAQQQAADLLAAMLSPSPDLSEGSIKPRPLIVISPFTRWPSKNWPLAQSIQAAIQLSDVADVLISGAPSDAAAIETELARQLASNDAKGQAEADSEHRRTHRPHNIAGKADLACFAEILRQSNLLITGDSFPMHLAGAVNTPVLALFGPTDEAKTGPRGSQSQVIRPKSCQRCDKPGCEKRCLSQISVEQVLTVASDLLGMTLSV